MFSNRFRSRAKKSLFWIFFSGMAVVPLLLSLYACTEWVGRRAEPQPADVIVVLGAAVWPQGPSPALRERLFLAARLYEEGYAKAIITTGGVGEFSPLPEGTAAKELLLAWGIPAEAVHAETTSRNTRENLRGAKAIMEEHGWNSAIIVTHDFHLWRALREARCVGIEATGAGVKETVLVRPPLVLREAVANGISIIRCWWEKLE